MHFQLRYHNFLHKRHIVNPKKSGPFHHRAPSKILYRAIRGMVPHKTARGAAALERLKLFEGVPPPYDKKKRMVVPGALRVLRLKPGRKFCTVKACPWQLPWLLRTDTFIASVSWGWLGLQGCCWSPRGQEEAQGSGLPRAQGKAYLTGYELILIVGLGRCPEAPPEGNFERNTIVPSTGSAWVLGMNSWRVRWWFWWPVLMLHYCFCTHQIWYGICYLWIAIEELVRHDGGMMADDFQYEGLEPSAFSSYYHLSLIFARCPLPLLVPVNKVFILLFCFLLLPWSFIPQLPLPLPPAHSPSLLCPRISSLFVHSSAPKTQASSLAKVGKMLPSFVTRPASRLVSAKSSLVYMNVCLPSLVLSSRWPSCVYIFLFQDQVFNCI